MPKDKRDSVPVSRKHEISMRGKFVFFSVFLFLIIVILGSIAFVFLMEQMLLDNARDSLEHAVAFERLQLQASINGEIAVVLKMANSPLIKRFFNDPADPELRRTAFYEIAAYRRAFVSNSVFWVTDEDKIFYFDDNDPYIIDPASPDNYWYSMTLYRTRVYNFNINFNPDLNVTNLWINAPVFDNEGIPIGIVGTGINLSDFIDAIYCDYSDQAEMLFFNSDGEITGAREIELVINKVGIFDLLMETGADILDSLSNLEPGKIISFVTHDGRGVVAVGSIPSLNWYVAAIQRFSTGDSLRNGMTVLFAIMLLVFFTVFAVFNVFAVRLLDPLNRMIKTMGRVASEWDLAYHNEAPKKDEIGALSEFLEMTIVMMNAKLNAERMAHDWELAKVRAEAAREAILSGIFYASKIQKNLLPLDSVFEKAFSDYSIKWDPKDIVGGDIYWIKNFDEGTVLCVCDCTGHGTPGALLTMLVVSTFENYVNDANCKDTAAIIWELEQKLVSVFSVKAGGHRESDSEIKQGCDLAVLFIAKDGNVTLSAGHTNVFVCDGKKVRRIKGQNVFIGEGSLTCKDDIETLNITADPDNKFYIASDGLFDQPGGGVGIPFGYGRFEKIILDNHNEKQPVISDRLWEVFETYRDVESRVDDFELITFKP